VITEHPQARGVHDQENVQPFRRGVEGQKSRGGTDAGLRDVRNQAKWPAGQDHLSAAAPEVPADWRRLRLGAAMARRGKAASRVVPAATEAGGGPVQRRKDQVRTLAREGILLEDGL
jgi:hypothetical protein